MKILKASAGSGKTYRLSKTYIDLLLNSGSRDAYRHILAVTFTNKATAEMKSRILSDLYRLSRSDSRARDMLVRMLHDYGSFAVSTIDRFFQQVLKSFSREIGQFADYRIELDKDSLVNEAMDRILDGITDEDEEVLNWIRESVWSSLARGDKPKVEEDLYKMGKLLKSEEHRTLCEKQGMDDNGCADKEKLQRVRELCDSIIGSFEARMEELGFPMPKPGTRLSLTGKKRLLSANPELKEYAEDNIESYNSAWIIRELLFSMGLAREFYSTFDALLQEKNVMSLDDSNTILKDIIGGSDAPFVYEKMGVRFEHFLLDEFQDTSNIQWTNFLPLLKESDANHHENLIVGDIKQSIYRFRDSDWKLLHEGVQASFPAADAEVMKGNWRSSSAVVEFNNGFFTFAAAQLGKSPLYGDVHQDVMRSESQSGGVRVSFTDDQDELVLSSIRDAMDAGAHYSDVAVLVRNKKEGSRLANMLIANGVPVISEDSLSVKSSSLICRLSSLLSAYLDPDNTISSYLVKSLSIEYPSRFSSLTDFCESLLRSLYKADPESFDGELLYIQAFMDDVKTWVEDNGNNLGAFLEHWEGSSPVIGSPEGEDAVRIITIHKSKGLEYPYVIFPYADKVTLYKPEVHWCALNSEGPFEDFSGIYPVKLSSDTVQSFFGKDYEEETERQRVDNLNIFYVALTRARNYLHIIAKPVSKSFRDAKSRSADSYKSMSELLYLYCGCYEDISFGKMYDFSALKREESDAQPFEAEWTSVPLGGRLQPAEEDRDFFSAEYEPIDGDGTPRVGAGSSARIKGIVLHEILSRVHTAADLDASLAAAVDAGKLGNGQAAGCREVLAAAVASRSCWFPEADSGVRVLNERSVFDGEGQEHRPDRVLLYGDGSVEIVDFKFGRRRDAYREQLSAYARLYEAMGYRVRRASLWYVERNWVDNVELN